MVLTRFEKARVLGARGLQLALGAPLLLASPHGVIDPIRLAEREWEAGCVPLSVQRLTDARH